MVGEIMKHNTYKILFLCIALGCCSFLFATGVAEKAPVKIEKPIIAVSILPQQYFVNRLAGDLVDSVVLVGEGQDPHSYEPTPSQMAQLSKAQAWVLSGTDFELSLKPKVASLYPKLSIVDGTEGMTFRTLEAHSHEGEEKHEEASGLNIDRHTWLGRKTAEIMVAHLRDTLITMVPDQKTVIEANYSALISEIEQVFAQLHTELASLQGRTVFVYHPAFGYFLDEFGIVQESVETGGKEPTAKALQSLIDEAQADHAVAIFVQSQFPVTAAKTIAESIGAQVLPLNPLAYDWMENIKQMGKTLLTAVEPIR